MDQRLSELTGLLGPLSHRSVRQTPEPKHSPESVPRVGSKQLAFSDEPFQFPGVRLCKFGLVRTLCPPALVKTSVADRTTYLCSRQDGRRKSPYRSQHSRSDSRLPVEFSIVRGSQLATYPFSRTENRDDCDQRSDYNLRKYDNIYA
ncbi:unnamed protein product [Rhizoctonia solani]|nr:unnamed protein product [Rhizoctonia solani]